MQYRTSTAPVPLTGTTPNTLLPLARAMDFAYAGPDSAIPTPCPLPVQAVTPSKFAAPRGARWRTISSAPPTFFPGAANSANSAFTRAPCPSAFPFTPTAATAATPNSKKSLPNTSPASSPSSAAFWDSPLSAATPAATNSSPFVPPCPKNTLPSPLSTNKFPHAIAFVGAPSHGGTAPQHAREYASRRWSF
jgi:hypothetical protein